MADYIELCAKDFGGFFTKFSFAVVSVLAIILCVKNSKCNKLFASVVAVAAYILGLILSFGSYLVFKQPLYEPRAFMGFNCFIAVVCFVLVKQVLCFEKKSRFIKCIFVPVLLYGCMVFLFTLGNCMSVQKKYQSFRMSVLMSDLDDFIVSDKDFDLTFSVPIGCNSTSSCYDDYGYKRYSSKCTGSCWTGYTIDNVTDGGLSTTEADKQKRYEYYMETRLAEDLLAKFSFIKSAYVEIYIPEQDGTLISSRNESQSSIWILLEMEQEIPTDTAAGIAQAVAVAIGNKTPENVVIMDTRGVSSMYANDGGVIIAV